MNNKLVDPGGAEAGGASEFAERLYEDLHRIAERYMKGERRGHTLQPTALIHEAFLRLAGENTVTPQSRTHFLALAARAMRQVLVNHAQARNAGKRGGRRQRVPLEDSLGLARGPAVDLLELDDALSELARLSPRQAEIVELRFFGGLGTDEIGTLLELSSRTIKREWRVARAWLLGRFG